MCKHNEVRRSVHETNTNTVTESIYNLRKCSTENNSEIIAACCLRAEGLNFVLGGNLLSGNPTTIEIHFHISSRQMRRKREAEFRESPHSQSTHRKPGLSFNLQGAPTEGTINNDFDSTDLYFNLTSVTVERIINEEWFLNGGPKSCSNFLSKFPRRYGAASPKRCHLGPEKVYTIK